MEIPGRVLLRVRALIADAGDEPIHDAALLIEAGRVESAGRYPVLRRNHPLAAVLDRSDLLALPGLVDAHSHGRGIPMLDHGIPDAPLEVWLTRLTAATVLDPYDQALVAAADLISTGVTSAQIFFHTFSEPEGYLEELAATVEGLKRGGINFDLALGISDQHEFVPPGAAAEPPDDTARSLIFPERGTDPDTFFELFDAIHEAQRGGADGNTTPARIAGALGESQLILGPIAPQWASDEILRNAAARSKRGTRSHTHLLERPGQRSPLYGTSPVRKLDEHGLLTDGISVAHGVWLESKEISLLGSQNVPVVHCPGSNSRLGAGVAPVRQLLDASVPVALGLDSHAVREPPDLFAEMRHALTKAGSLEAQIPAREVLSMATRGGAAAVGRQGEIGTLQPGARADLILLDAPDFLGNADHPVTSIVAGASREAVRETWVGGRPLLRDGRHALSAEISAARRRLQNTLLLDGPRRRRRLRELQKIEPWLQKLWEEA